MQFVTPSYPIKELATSAWQEDLPKVASKNSMTKIRNCSESCKGIARAWTLVLFNLTFFSWRMILIPFVLASLNLFEPIWVYPLIWMCFGLFAMLYAYINRDIDLVFPAHCSLYLPVFLLIFLPTSTESRDKNNNKVAFTDAFVERWYNIDDELYDWFTNHLVATLIVIFCNIAIDFIVYRIVRLFATPDKCLQLSCNQYKNNKESAKSTLVQMV